MVKVIDGMDVSMFAHLYRIMGLPENCFSPTRQL
jgi:hypothetical protein